MAKSMGKGKFRPSQLQNHLVDFDEIRTLQISPEDHLPHKTSFRSDDVGGLGESPVWHCHWRQFPGFMFPQVVQRQ